MMLLGTYWKTPLLHQSFSGVWSTNISLIHSLHTLVWFVRLTYVSGRLTHIQPSSDRYFWRAIASSDSAHQARISHPLDTLARLSKQRPQQYSTSMKNNTFVTASTMLLFAVRSVGAFSHHSSAFMGRTATARSYSSTRLTMKLQTAIVGLPNVGKVSVCFLFLLMMISVIVAGCLLSRTV